MAAEDSVKQGKRYKRRGASYEVFVTSIYNLSNGDTIISFREDEYFKHNNLKNVHKGFIGEKVAEFCLEIEEFILLYESKDA